MKIALNGKILSRKNPAGPELYTKNLFESLAKIDKTNEYVVYTDSDKINFDQGSFKVQKLAKSLSWIQVSLASKLLKETPEVFFSTVHTIPIFKSPKMKVVGMVHGLESRYNERTSILFNLLRGRHEWFVSKFSDALIVPSSFTKEAILSQKWGIPEKKINVIPEGVGREFHPRSASETSSVREKYGLSTDPYIIFVSTIQPRKNLPILVDAFSRFKKSHPDSNLKLLVVGKNGWDYNDSLKAPEKYGVKESVIFAGRVPDEDLPVLLSGATAYVSSSLEEGFGLTLLEAMASGIPAIVSNIDAFKETGGDTVWYIDPRDPEDIKDSLTQLLSGRYDTNLIQKSQSRAAEYTWEKAAQKTLKVFESIV